MPDDLTPAYIVHMKVGPIDRLQLRRVADDWVIGRLACGPDRERDIQRLRRAPEKHGYVVEDVVKEEVWRRGRVVGDTIETSVPSDLYHPLAPSCATSGLFFTSNIRPKSRVRIETSAHGSAHSNATGLGR